MSRRPTAGISGRPGKIGFVVLLFLGLFSFGFIAMLIYVIAGPDGTEAAKFVAAYRPGRR